FVARTMQPVEIGFRTRNAAKVAYSIARGVVEVQAARPVVAAAVGGVALYTLTERASIGLPAPCRARVGTAGRAAAGLRGGPPPCSRIHIAGQRGGLDDDEIGSRGVGGNDILADRKGRARRAIAQLDIHAALADIGGQRAETETALAVGI